MVMVMAAVPVIIGLWRTVSARKRLREFALLVARSGMRVSMLMGRAVMVVDMHMGVPGARDRHSHAARQPEDREERSEHSDDQHDGRLPHQRHCTSGSVTTSAPPVPGLPSEGPRSDSPTSSGRPSIAPTSCSIFIASLGLAGACGGFGAGRARAVGPQVRARVPGVPLVVVEAVAHAVWHPVDC